MDRGDLLHIIKRAALEAVRASKPADTIFGTVVSAEPLRIRIDQKLTLTEAQLVLTMNVVDYAVAVETEVGEQLIPVHTALAVGERVVLLQAAGGQRYVVIDRIGR